MRDLIQTAKRIRDRACQAYKHQRVTMIRQEIRQETREEIRRVLRMHDMGSAAFD